MSKAGKRLLDDRGNSFANSGYGAERPLGSIEATKMQDKVLRQPHEGIALTPDE